MKLTGFDVHMAFIYASQRPGTGPKWHELSEEERTICNITAIYLNSMMRDMEINTDEHAIVRAEKRDPC